MQKIIVRMRGGLGNQLFILACAYYISKNSRRENKIIIDNREYNTYKIRNFELLDIVKDTNLQLYQKEYFSLKYEITRRIYHVVQKIVNPKAKVNKLLASIGLVYSKRNSEGAIKAINKNKIYIYGYFQDYKMAKAVKKIIKEKIKNKNEIKLEEYYKYIAVSIRCGKDYVEGGWPICSKEYYVNGVEEIIKEKYKNEDVKILVFADDTKEAKKIKFGYKTDYIDNLSSGEQLLMMEKCDDFVIANSSFSWWGAFLGVKADSIVIAPNVWYSNKTLTKESLLAFENMRYRSI